MRIGILEASDVDERLRHHNQNYTEMFADLLKGHGFEFVKYDAYRNELPDAPEECDGWLIGASRYGVYEDLPWIAPLEDFVRKVYAAKIPLVGICFGHQIMAQALGGKVVKSDKGWGAGVQRYDSAETGGEIAILASHQDQVVEKPASAKVIASSEFCEFAGFAYDGPALSYQPHPEFSREYMAGIIGIRRGTAYSHEFAEARLAEMDAALDSDWMGGRIAEFFLEHQPE
jgi:GMP synthase (glutamine-hydrolysing)